MVNQLGDYFDTIEGGTVSQPAGEYFDNTPGGGITGTGSYYTPAPAEPMNGSPDGIGRALGDVLALSPLVRDLRKLRPRQRAISGLGETDVVAPTPVQSTRDTGMLVFAVMTGIIARGVAGYFVGKALAPSQQVEKKYAWWGVPTAIIFGTVGMGVEAGIALIKR